MSKNLGNILRDYWNRKEHEAADLIEQQKRIDDLERSLKSEERLSFRHQLEESQAREALQQKRINELEAELETERCLSFRNQVEKQQERIEELESRATEAWASHMRYKLAAAQADNKRLRDALYESRGWNWLDEDVAPKICQMIDEALAQPTDTTALREMLRQERERCILELQRNDYKPIDEIVSAIRAMEEV